MLESDHGLFCVIACARVVCAVASMSTILASPLYDVSNCDEGRLLLQWEINEDSNGNDVQFEIFAPTVSGERAELTLTKSVVPVAIIEGEMVSYTFTITNAGCVVPCTRRRV